MLDQATVKAREVGICVEGALSVRAVRGSVRPTMIKLIVRQVAEKAGIKSARDLSKRADLHYETARLLWNGESRRVDLDTIERVCDLLQVPPGQLFEYKSESSK